MKTLIWIPVVLLGLLISGCVSQVTFDTPQPAGELPIPNFPTTLLGEYFSTDSVSVLTISDSAIVRFYDYDLKCHKDTLPEATMLHEDTLLIADYDGYITKQKITFTPDSYFVYHEHIIDTLFKISEYAMLKKYKGHYFLNDMVQTDSNKTAWGLRELSITNGILTITFIDNQEEMKKLKEIPEPNNTAYFYKRSLLPYRLLSQIDRVEKVDTFFRMRK